MSTCLADRAWLTRRYVSDRASIRDIAAELGCSTYPVAQALIRHGIPRRARGDRARDAGQPVWTAQPPAPPAPPAGADTEPLETTLTQLHDANASRTRTAAARTVDAARRALLDDRACPPNTEQSCRPGSTTRRLRWPSWALSSAPARTPTRPCCAEP